MVFSGGSDGKESVCICGRPGFHPRVGKSRWRRERLPTPVFWPGEFHGQRSLAVYSPWGRKELDRTEPLTLSLFLSTCGGIISLHPGFVHQWEKTASHHCFRPIICIPLLLSSQGRPNPLRDAGDSSWQWSSTFLASGTGLVEDNFPTDQEGGDGFKMIQAHCIYCALFLLLLHQLPLRSSGIRSQRLGAPILFAYSGGRIIRGGVISKSKQTPVL